MRPSHLRLGRIRLWSAVPAVSIALVVVLAACQAAASASPTTVAVPSVAPSTSTGGVAPIEDGPPLAVLGTENFYADLLTQIGGARVTATSILNDPNADPHEFESSPADAVLVADARLVVVNGLGYDDFMQKLLGASNRPDRVVIDVQQLLGLPDDVNVHIWYDPATMPKVAAAVADALAKLDPPNATYFAAQEQAYLAALGPIATKIADLKAKYAGTPIAFTEDVAGYLTDQIGLVVKTSVGFMKSIEEGTDPAPIDVAAEQDLFTTKQVRILVYNSQVTSPTTERMREIAVQNGIGVVGVSETIPAAFPTFQAWQLAQLDQLADALARAG
jgi:zinc/manganese transport system substrate-binding protein